MTDSGSSFLEDNADIDNVTDALTAVGYDLAHSEAVHEAVNSAADSYAESTASAMDSADAGDMDAERSTYGM